MLSKKNKVTIYVLKHGRVKEKPQSLQGLFYFSGKQEKEMEGYGIGILFYSTFWLLGLWSLFCLLLKLWSLIAKIPIARRWRIIISLLSTVAVFAAVINSFIFVDLDFKLIAFLAFILVIINFVVKSYSPE